VAWDTANLAPGQYFVSFQVKPEGPAWRQSVTLSAPLTGQLQWQDAQSDCCTMSYISSSAAEWDIEQIRAMVDVQAQDVSNRLHAAFNQSIPLVLMPRLLGHGGFTSDKIYISYLDRNYAGDDISLVLHHEMVHQLDNQLGGELRPTLLVEGLAVYLTGGHFKPEPLLLRAAILPELDLYLPLPALADNFYTSQHEIGYLEAGALIAYMVNTWGWDNFTTFYRDIKPIPNAGQSAAIDAALNRHFAISLRQLEDKYLNFLAKFPVNPDLRTDVRMMVSYFDTVRRYQKILDPSAYFRQAWLPDAAEMRKKGIVADFVRHPNTPTNQAIELLLINAREDWIAGRFDQAEQSIRAINAVLAAIQEYSPEPMAVHPTAAEMFAVVQVLDRCGMEPQHIQLESKTGQATVIIAWPNRVDIKLVKSDQSWQTQPACQPAVLPSQPGLLAARQEWQYLTP
jgi:hypothetical protein